MNNDMNDKLLSEQELTTIVGGFKVVGNRSLITYLLNFFFGSLLHKK